MKRISVDIKQQVLRRLKTGDSQVDVDTSLNLPTIRTIIKNATKMKSSASKSSNFSTTKVTRPRTHLFEEMEKRLRIWVDNQMQRCMPLSQMIIIEKAKSIFKSGAEAENFIISRAGWINRFKKRANLRNIRISDEAASSDVKAAEEFPEQDVQQLFESYIESVSSNDVKELAELCTDNKPTVVDAE
ncbi:CENPB DNA-binding domain-containing protein 1 [Trichinella zimbabwensis]|uniref:CENPB DNA-binding domain-containing protein 1 n=1 Tax=Trichinella zimbabwensis TaxID=268475 RepID=A0A0V1HPC0_9BILA|nr:CENPB DNA-binding domain-containing protein 1 [Trichinella zimbabwensis]